MVETIKSMFVHLIENSEYMNRDEWEFWSSSGDKWIGKSFKFLFAFCLSCVYFFQTACFVYFCKENIVSTERIILGVLFHELTIFKCLLGFLNLTFSFIAVTINVLNHILFCTKLDMHCLRGDIALHCTSCQPITCKRYLRTAEARPSGATLSCCAVHSFTFYFVLFCSFCYMCFSWTGTLHNIVIHLDIITKQ
jgi:hypothetical protein